jgi:preprotein translocase subunit SecA
MSWIKKLNPFAKDEPAAGDGAKAPADLPPGMAAMFFRKWKDPAFLKQMRVLAGHMQRDGVDIRDRAAVQAWLEKNKERLEKGELNEEAAKPGETFVKTGPEIGRNDPCHCGSGKKFKKCHGA